MPDSRPPAWPRRRGAALLPRRPTEGACHPMRPPRRTSAGARAAPRAAPPQAGRVPHAVRGGAVSAMAARTPVPSVLADRLLDVSSLPAQLEPPAPEADRRGRFFLSPAGAPTL